jgi:protein ImuB
LHESLDRWGRLVRDGLERLGFRAVVVVGFNRFGSYAVAKAKRGMIVFREPEDERAAARRVALDRLSFPPPVRDTLTKLGVRSVGDFVDLPAAGIAKRFGPEVERLHRLAAGRLQPPLRPERPSPPLMRRMALEHSETNVARLMLVVERLIDPLLTMADNAGQALVEVRVGFRFERTGDHIETLRPAAPTLDARQLVELIRLRMQAVRKLPDGVVEVVLMARGAPAVDRQLQLLAGKQRRDLEAANRALARVRADLGDDAVRRARLRDGHLPEASFAWDTVDRVKPPEPHEADRSRLVRRIYVPPIPLPSRPRHEPDGWMLRNLKQGPVVRVLGPFVVSGGWWKRPVHREYHFAETQRGELLWVYYDRPRRRWYLQGRVE